MTKLKKSGEKKKNMKKKIFCNEQLDTLTTDDMYPRQPLAISQCFTLKSGQLPTIL